MSLFLDLDGRAPRIAASAWVAPDVVLTGDVEIGEDATVWFGVIARGDTESIVLARGANVQDGSVLHADPGMPLRLGREAAVREPDSNGGAGAERSGDGRISARRPPRSRGDS